MSAPADPHTRFIAALGDVNNPVTYNGLPYHLLQASRKCGILDEGLPLDATSRQWKLSRALWNGTRPFLLDRWGGYQYSRPFLRRLWAPVRKQIHGSVVLNTFQLYSDDVINDASVHKWFFIDLTLRQLFFQYGDHVRIGRRVREGALRLESEGYAAAEGLIANSRWAAESFKRDYGISEDRVYVVTQGAAFEPELYDRWVEQEEKTRACRATHDETPLRLVFLGVDWRRKGLDRLLGAMHCAQRQGFQGKLRIIGCERDQLPAGLLNVKDVEWIGYVEKRKDWPRFFRLVADADVGCLLSRAEAGGLGICEYHALGLAVLGTAAGGAPDQMLADASVVIPVDAGDEEIAAILLRLDSDRDFLQRMRDNAWRQRRKVTWSHSVDQMREFWPYPGVSSRG